MSSLRIAIVVLLCILATATAAAGQWSRNGQKVDDTAWRKSDGDFGAMLLVTDDYDSFVEQWEKPAAPGYKPYISTTDRAARGDTVMVVILFQGCAAAESGSCQAVVDFKVVRPDGTIYADHEGAPLWEGAVPPAGTLQLGSSQMGFQVELDDPLGEYRIVTRVRDTVSKRTLTLTRPLTVTLPGEATPAKRTETDR